MLEQFHFTQPLWLLALLPLLLLLRLGFQATSSSKAWDKIIDPNLLPVLLQGKDSGSGTLVKLLLAIGWLIAVVALANPVWEQVPRPIFQTNAARVIVLDLSNSMLAADLKPNRLARAKFKVEDILALEEEGQTGLVLFAGDAFIASPLTRDKETIRSLLKILTPQLLPAQGSRADLGLLKAHELFKQAGITKGQVLMVADGVSKSNAAIDAAKDLKRDGHSVSVLGVGTEAGGELKFRNNKNVTVKLEAETLKNLAIQGGGKYHLISTGNADLSQVLIAHNTGNDVEGNTLQEQDSHNEEWYSTGPLIILLLLPLAAFAFRRGWLLNIAFVAISGGVLLQPQPVIAFTLDDLWSTLSQNKEQQADAALRNENYEKASELSREPFRRGVAQYKQGNFEAALQSFKESEGADASYNKGNALAKLKKYEAAIESYDQALSLNPDMADAKENKAVIEEFLKKQQHAESDAKEKPDSKDKQDQKGSEEQQGEKGEQEGEQEGEQKNEQQDSDKKGQQESGEQSSNKNEDNQESQNKDEGSESDEEQGNQFSEANKALDEKKQGQKDNDDEEAAAEEKNVAEDKLADEVNNEVAASEGEEKNEEEIAEDARRAALDRADLEEAKELSEEEKMAAEQWLRRIPDDPGGLLRRKFRSQYQQRRRNADNSEQPW